MYYRTSFIYLFNKEIGIYMWCELQIDQLGVKSKNISGSFRA